VARLGSKKGIFAAVAKILMENVKVLKVNEKNFCGGVIGLYVPLNPCRIWAQMRPIAGARANLVEIFARACFST
jgi:hypothetical protein